MKQSRGVAHPAAHSQVMLLLLLLGLGVVASANGQLPVDCAEVPPDPVISASIWPAAGAAWLGDSSASLQGWDEYQLALVDGATGPGGAQYIHRLITERLPGVAALVMQPPKTAFKYGGGGGAGGSNDTTFAAAVKAFRGAGLKVLLYSSLVHKGEDVQWANGSLFKHHPNWSQRHRDGSPTCLGNGVPCKNPMLSPSSKAAVEFEVNYTLGLLQQFPADGVYLDDNELGVFELVVCVRSLCVLVALAMSCNLMGWECFF